MKNKTAKKTKKDECQKCGHCCKNLIIEIGEHDVLREPKLLEHIMKSAVIEPPKEDWEYDLNRQYGLEIPCHFLVDNKCSIYPTRPNVCVGFEFGSFQCKYGASDAEQIRENKNDR